MGRYGDAIEQCGALLETHPRNADALFIRGQARLAKGDKAAGEADIAAAKDADHRIALYYRMYRATPS
jgi:hypothetical protein